MPISLNNLFSINPGKKAPGLLIIFMMLSTLSMALSNPEKNVSDTLPAPQLFTVANIGVLPGNTAYYEVIFYQSARFYKLMRNNKNCKAALVLLKQSKKANKPVLVILTEKFGDVIDQVKKNNK
jgi:hypothetical protein